MSVGSSALGTLLVQRLDAVLGTTMAQHANLISGARPDAVSQASAAARLLGPDTAMPRNEREMLERTLIEQIRGGSQGKVGDGVSEAAVRAAVSRLRQTSIAYTPSAPTSLGLTARTILALLARFPEPAPPALGRAPLWPPADGDPALAARDYRAAAAPASQAALAASAAGRNVADTAKVIDATHVAGAATPSSAPTAALLARVLAQTLDTSGLFYESHLAGLAFGKRTAAQLRAEPQAQLPAARAATGRSAGDPAEMPAAAGAPAGRAETSPTASATLPTNATHAAVADAVRADAPTTAGPQPALATGGVHPEAALLVRQQLEILANQAVAWRGLAWTDTPMWWQVCRDDAGADDGGVASPASWSSRLVLDLPKLGRVQASIRLMGEQVSLHLGAGDSAALLQAESAGLRSRYSAAGFQLGNLKIDQGQAAPPGSAAPPDRAADAIESPAGNRPQP